MDHRETLTVFAEVSVAFAGFAGLAGLLARRFSGDAATLATMRLRGVIEWALLVVAFSLAPLILLAFAPTSAWVWRVVSLALAVSALAHATLTLRHLRSLPWGGRSYRTFVIAWLFGAAFFLLINGLGFLAREAEFYLLGLAAYFLFTMFLFVRLFRSIFSQDAEQRVA